MARGDDEHMNVPTWRMRQLQNIEQAARQAVELINVAPVKWPEASLVATVRDLLVEALGDD
jgi:hypothetical protein